MKCKTVAGKLVSLALCLVLGGGSAMALTLSDNENVADGVLGGAGGETVRTNLADGVTFWWADANGDGIPDDPVSAGFYLNGKELTRTADTIGIKLDLFDGKDRGVLDGRTNGVLAGVIKTTRSGDAGSIMVTNAASVKVRTIAAQRTSNYGSSGAISLLNVGDIEVESLISGSPTLAISALPITVRHSGNFTAALISDENGATTVNRTNSLMTISGDGSGACTIGAIKHKNARPGDIVIENYNALAIGSGGIEAYTVVHNPCSIHIRNIGGDVTVSGDIRTYRTNYSGGSIWRAGIHITNIAGNVQTGHIDMHMGNWGAQGNIQINDVSDGVQVTAAGAIELGDITTYHGTTNTYNNGYAHGGKIEVTSSAGSVSVGNLDTRTARSNATARGGDVTLTACGDLSITGDSMDLSASFSAANHGSLTMTTVAGSGGRIHVGATTEAVFDLNRLLTATFDSDAGRTDVAGTLAHFNVGSSGGTGTAGNPYITLQTVLRAPVGQVIYYNYSGGMNAYLGGATYRVADLSGTAGAGGLLMPEHAARAPGIILPVAGEDGGGATNSFHMGKFEVDSASFAMFLNESEAAAAITIASGAVTRSGTGELYLLTTQAASGSHVAYNEAGSMGARFAAMPGKDEQPVIYVTWFGAAAYCNWLSERESIEAAYNPSNNWSLAGASGYRLPTEDEWLKAAAWNKDAGAFFLYGTGSDTLRPLDANFLNSGDPCETNVIRTTGVGYYLAASPYGIHDACGNVWEWCHNTCDPEATDPAAAAHALRGGSWGNLAQDVTSATRIDNPPGAARNSVGFRLMKPATN